MPNGADLRALRSVPPADVVALRHALGLNGKFVIGTPLRTWELLQWPNVFLTDLRVDAWVEAIVRAQHSRWKSEWDIIIEAFDWDALADRMAAVMLGAEVRESLPCAS